MFFDTHTHLDYLAQRTQRPLSQIVDDANRANIQKMLLTAVNAQQFTEFSQLTAPFQQQIPFGLGLHPLFIEQHQTNDLLKLEDALMRRAPNCCAIAEIGLERGIESLITPVLWQKQLVFFHAQLELAQQFKLPVSLHSRKSHPQLLAILKKNSPEFRGVIHGFSGSYEQAKQFVDLGYFIGVGGVITYPRANKTRQAIVKLPNDCLLLETDSPDMPLAGQQGRANTPSNIPTIFHTLCDLKSLTPLQCEQLKQQIWQNSVTLFSQK
ncbi:deoxyribonuclease [Actinobacillus delphinicola]|uniref:TatD family hydrolase n=1 Tax=Actinobacillus delphinicola TaxID=51161 RepID=UPI002441EBF2|nr:TatD family hydrolase [Actinobacillus delphinicola]MDG6897549.1 deoxyribonuclease [Actinobacillus delphinicola]